MNRYELDSIGYLKMTYESIGDIVARKDRKLEREIHREHVDNTCRFAVDERIEAIFELVTKVDRISYSVLCEMQYAFVVCLSILTYLSALRSTNE